MDDVIIPITNRKQVKLIKLLHEGAIPLNKARIILKDTQPKVIVDRLNIFFANIISTLKDDSFSTRFIRGELEFIVGHGFPDTKLQQIRLSDNVIIENFYPDKENPTIVTLRILRQPRNERHVSNTPSSIPVQPVPNLYNL